MPRIVDHDARRREVATVATKMIIAAGLDAVSIREIAATAGCSTAIFTHYFKTKRELLLYIYRMNYDASVAGMLHPAPMKDQLQGCLDALLPIDAVRAGRWKLNFAFWGLALADDAFRSEQEQRSRTARRIIGEVLELSALGAALSPAELDLHARRLIACVAGIATQAVHDPDDWPPARQRAVLAYEIAACGR